MNFTVFAVVIIAYAMAIMCALQWFWSHHVIILVLSFITCRYIFRRLIFVFNLSTIPGPPGIPVLGNSLSLTGGQEDFFRLLLEYRRTYGPIFKLWIGMRPFIFISNAEYVKPILSSSLHIDKSYEYSFLQPWLGTGLLTATATRRFVHCLSITIKKPLMMFMAEKMNETSSQGSKWHERRKLLTPSFHHSLLEEFIEPIVKKTQILVELLEKEVDKPPFNSMDYTKLCALDIICVTAMGKDINAQLCEGTEYVRAIEGLNKIVQRRFITPWLKPDFIFSRCYLGKMQNIYVEIINGFVSKVIQERKSELQKNNFKDQTSRKRKAFLDLILEAATDGQELSDEDIREEVNTFMFAGHDTTSVAISWCLYVLGKHKEVQQKIVDEYNNVVQNEIPTYKEIQKLEYLENCIKETMRLYPVVPLIARDVKHKIQINDSTTLLPGITALIFTPSLHRDARVFKKPDEFQPERFLENHGRNPFSYIPFSAGPRNCIGAKFAMIEIKVVIYNILKTYEVISMDSENELNLMSEIVLSNKDGIRILLKKRSENC